MENSQDRLPQIASRTVIISPQHVKVGLVVEIPAPNHMSHELSHPGPFLSMKYWLFNRDPYNGLL